MLITSLDDKSWEESFYMLAVFFSLSLHLSFLLHVTTFLKHFVNFIFIIHTTCMGMPRQSLGKYFSPPPPVKVGRWIGARCCAACNSGFVGVARSRQIVRKGRRRAFRALALRRYRKLLRPRIPGPRDILRGTSRGTPRNSFETLARPASWRDFSTFSGGRYASLGMNLWFFCATFSSDSRISNARSTHPASRGER